MPTPTPLADVYRLILPEIALVGVACLLYLLAAFRPRRDSAMALALVGVLGAGVLALLATGALGGSLLGWREADAYAAFGPQAHALSPFVPGGVADFGRGFVLALGVLFVLLARSEVRDDNAGEYYGSLLVLLAGASLAARANDLVTMYLALELVSVPTYVLLALPSRVRPNQEAAVKYFLLSVLSSAFLLFGFSYLYGLTGSTNLGAVADTLAAAHRVAVNPLGVVAAVMVIAGLAFRVTAVPFHFYAPDVYEGGPTGVVANLAVVPKVAGFMALARVLGLLAPVALPFDAANTLVPLTLWVLAAVTMTFGNLLALLQDNLKRLMAYSGIAHGGYMLIAFVVVSNGVPTAGGLDALLVYLVAYALMTVGFFAVLIHLDSVGNPAETVDDLAGLGSSHPASAALLTVSLLSLIGIPLTAGFAGKFLLFLGAFDLPAGTPMQNLARGLAILAAVNAAVAGVYYLRVLSAMYLRAPLRDTVPVRGASWPRAVAAACAVGTVVLGCYPDAIQRVARAAVATP